MIYEKIIRPIFFKTDPERIHDSVIFLLATVSRIKFLRVFFKRFLFVKNEALKVKMGNLVFANPVGLAAGFDKYAKAPAAYPMLGFGFAEIGSVTYLKQPGNPKPRLWRIPRDKGIIVHYGMPNAGAQKTKKILEKFKEREKIYGVSIGPSTGVALEEMADEYVKSFLELNTVADYVTLNVSCPNVVASEIFAQVGFIDELLGKIFRGKTGAGIIKDIYIKIGPHFSEQQLDQIIESCLRNGITGVIVSNLLKQRDKYIFKSDAKKLDHPGGISGEAVRDLSNATIKYIFKKAGDKIKIIGLGGIFTAEDAYEKIKCGASAVQIITGFIYGGPMVVRKINLGVVELLKKDGYKNISEAVGK